MPLAKNSSPGSNSGTASAAEAFEGTPRILLNVRKAVRAKVLCAYTLRGSTHPGESRAKARTPLSSRLLSKNAGMKLGKSIPPRTEKLISQSASENPGKKPRRDFRKEFRSSETSLFDQKRPRTRDHVFGKLDLDTPTQSYLPNRNPYQPQLYENLNSLHLCGGVEANVFGFMRHPYLPTPESTSQGMNPFGEQNHILGSAFEYKIAKYPACPNGQSGKSYSFETDGFTINLTENLAFRTDGGTFRRLRPKTPTFNRSNSFNEENFGEVAFESMKVRLLNEVQGTDSKVPSRGFFLKTTQVRCRHDSQEYGFAVSPPGGSPFNSLTSMTRGNTFVFHNSNNTLTKFLRLATNRSFPSLKKSIRYLQTMIARISAKQFHSKYFLRTIHDMATGNETVYYGSPEAEHAKTNIQAAQLSFIGRTTNQIMPYKSLMKGFSTPPTSVRPRGPILHADHN